MKKEKARCSGLHPSAKHSLAVAVAALQPASIEHPLVSHSQRMVQFDLPRVEGQPSH